MVSWFEEAASRRFADDAGRALDRVEARLFGALTEGEGSNSLSRSAAGSVAGEDPGSVEGARETSPSVNAPEGSAA
jgi:hypothetical protein